MTNVDMASVEDICWSSGPQPQSDMSADVSYLLDTSIMSHDGSLAINNSIQSEGVP